MDKTTIIFILLLIFASGGAAWHFKPAERIYHTEHQQRQIDSLSVALTNTQATKESLRDSLENTTEAFQKYVEEHDGEVASLTTIKGKLNLKVDQLEDSLERVKSEFIDLPMMEMVSASSQCIEDVKIPVSQTFGDSLFQVTSINEFKNNQFRDELQLEQLRMLRIDVAQLISDDRRTVESLVTSPDFDSLQVSAQTTITPPKRKVHWSILVSVGILVREAANLIFK